LGDSILTVKKNTEALLFTNNEVCLEGGIEKTKYVFTSHEQNAGNNTT